VPQVRTSVPGTKKMGEAQRPLLLSQLRLFSLDRGRSIAFPLI
jgi:hypothetical protein